MSTKFLKEGVVYGIGGALSRFTGMFVTPIYTRFMSSEEYGILDMGTTVSSMLLILLEMQMVTGFMRHYYDSKQKGDRHILFGSVSLYFILAYAVFWTVAVVFRPQVLSWLPGFEWSTLLPVLIILLPNLFMQLTLGVLRLEHKPKIFLIYSVGQTWLAATLGIVAVVWFDYGAEGILWAFAIAKSVFSIPAVIYCVKTMSFSPRMRYFRQVFSYSAPIVPAVMGNWVNSYMSRFFIVGALSLSALGVYSLSYKVASVFLLLTVGFRMAWNPFALKQFTKKGTEPVFVKAYAMYFFAAFAFLVVIGSGTPWLVRLFATPQYYEAMAYVTIISAAFLWDGSVNILAIGNNWEKKTYFNMMGSLVAGGLNILLLWTLIELFGLKVAAFAFLISSMTQALIIFGIAQRVHYIPHRKSAIAGSVIVTLIFAVSSYLAQAYIDSDIMVSAVLFAVGGILVLYAWYGILTEGDRASMIQMIRRLMSHRVVQKYVLRR